MSDAEEAMSPPADTLGMRIAVAVALSVVLGGCTFQWRSSLPSAPAPPVGPGGPPVYVDVDDFVASDAVDGATLEELQDALAALHSAWLRMDADAYRALLARDAPTRATDGGGGISVGADAIVGELADDWAAFEKTEDGAAIALDVEVFGARARVDGDVAEVVSWVYVDGGMRWDFEDLGVMFDVFVRAVDADADAGGDVGWRLLHHTESWGHDYDVDNELPGARTFELDFAHPVTDLARAVAFYTPLLGEPEVQRADWATFKIGARRFSLDAADLADGAAVNRAGLPNGYAIFHVDDIAAERARLLELGAAVIVEERARGSDVYFAAQDPAGNVFVVMEPRAALVDAADAAGAGPTLSIEGALPAGIEELWTSWLALDRARFLSSIDAGAEWFDDSRDHTEGISRGSGAVADRVDQTWRTLDRLAGGGALVSLAIDDVHSAPLGAGRTLVTYRLRREGVGEHAFRDTIVVTHVVGAGGRVERTFLVNTSSAPSSSSPVPAPVSELDYVGYPQSNLDGAAAFWSAVLRDSEPYYDAGWVGFWSVDAVFGLFEASPADDGIPVAGRANGYVSFAVSSAADTYAQLCDQGSAFPVVAALVGVEGLDAQPGYVQVYATDSEGNGVMFTQYTGE